MRDRALLRSTWFAGASALALAGAVTYGPASAADLFRNAGAAPAPAAAAAHDALPTLPASGTLDVNGSTTVTFAAPNRVGASVDATTCAGPNCSLYVLNVAEAGNKIVRLRLDWTNVSNDYDLYVYEINPDGSEGDEVDRSGGATNSELVTFFPSDSTAYHVVIVHFAATAPDTIHGTVSLVDAPPAVQPVRKASGHGIAFSPTGGITLPDGRLAPSGKGTFFSKETVRDGEPSIRVDQLGNVYAAGIRGVPAGVDVWRIPAGVLCPTWIFHDDEEIVAGKDPTDGGYVWLGQPDGIFQDGAGAPDGGGGDIELAVNEKPGATQQNPPNLSMVSLTLANITSAMSTNRGDDWTPPNAVAATVPLDDRQWIDAFGQNTVYLNYRTLATLTGLVLNKSIDGGMTYATATTIVNPIGLTPGWIAVDKKPDAQGRAHIYISSQSSSELVVFHCVDPTPNAVSTITCTDATVDTTTSHGHIFDPVAVDRAGNVYAAWSNNRNIYYAYSTDRGATWSQPVQVTNAGDGVMPNFNFFPWITAGDDGRIGIVWYGTSARRNTDNNSEWKAYYALIPDARAAVPTVNWLAVSDQYIHKGNLSQGGLSLTDSTLNRNLIDFFQVAHEPKDGAAVVAFAADYNDFDGATYYARQVAGPTLFANKTLSGSCPALTPFRNPEVIDFPGDAVANADTRVPLPDVDIRTIDYGWQKIGNNLFITAEMEIDDLLVTPPPARSYRIYFAVNAQRGLMDTGDEYFMELVTTETGTPTYYLGMKNRRADGTSHEVRTTENITADQPAVTLIKGAPGLISMRVNVNRLNFTFNNGSPVKDFNKPTPTEGDLVIGLMGRTRINVGSVGQTVLVDETRGGSYVLLGAAGQ